jgi:hypothetical protein
MWGALGKADDQRGSDRGSPNDGRTPSSKRVTEQIRSPVRMRTRGPVPWRVSVGREGRPERRLTIGSSRHEIERPTRPGMSAFALEDGAVYHTPIPPMCADWTASGACTSGSTAPPRGATRRASGGAATTSTTPSDAAEACDTELAASCADLMRPPIRWDGLRPDVVDHVSSLPAPPSTCLHGSAGRPTADPRGTRSPSGPCP